LAARGCPETLLPRESGGDFTRDLDGSSGQSVGYKKERPWKMRLGGAAERRYVEAFPRLRIAAAVKACHSAERWALTWRNQAGDLVGSARPKIPFGRHTGHRHRPVRDRICLAVLPHAHRIPGVQGCWRV